MTEVVASLQLSFALQEKYDNSVGSYGIMGFTSKLHKYFGFSTKVNSDHGGTNSSKSSEDNANHSSSTNEDGSEHHEMPHPDGELGAQDLKMFTYGELKQATSDFDTWLGEGIYGKVYKGWVNKMTYSPSRRNIRMPVAVKILHYTVVRLKKMELDLNLLKEEFSHPNLLKPIGYCLNGEELLLVYPLMQNGSLEDYLLTGAVARLPLEKKVKIVVGIARGLVFLHKTQDKDDVCLPRFERRNILLNEDFTVKLQDYDVDKLVGGRYTRVYDCLDCYYYPGFKPSELQSNLSGFTVVFGEVLTGQTMSNGYEYGKVKHSLLKDGIIESPYDLHSFAELCFEICNEEDSELQMLRVLKKFDKYIPAWPKGAFTAAK